VKEHAQELEDEVIDKHIALFVNDYTLSLGNEGRKAVEKLIGKNRRIVLKNTTTPDKSRSISPHDRQST
jgi:predicted solute-binding protein